MLLGTNRVWDYAGDNFVHRLLQNKNDGKLVEAQQPSKEPVSKYYILTKTLLSGHSYKKKKKAL